MPRSRGSEVPQRQSPRGPVQHRTSSSDSDPPHRQKSTDRSTKPGDRRSPRVTQTDSLNQKQLGTRIAGLESQLGQAQKELKILKEQLASVEAAKSDEAQEQLEKKTQKPSASDLGKVVQDEHPPSGEPDSNPTDNGTPHETSDDIQHETDVFEVPMEKVTVESKVEFCQPIDQEDQETKPGSLSTEPPEPQFDDLALKNNEIDFLKAKLGEKEKELEVWRQENESLKGQLHEAGLEKSKVQAKEGEMISRVNQLEVELEASKTREVQLKEKLDAVKEAKEALEAEMKKLRVQTQQWRKAADAAAAVLAGGTETNGRRISKRCGSMDKHYGSFFEPPLGGYTGYVGSPGMGDDSDDGFGSGKRKGSGIRMFGELWKKKGQK